MLPPPPQALSGAREAINRFQSEGTNWLRPPDYYAEMVKSDEQMARIKDRLMYEQQQIDQAAERCVWWRGPGREGKGTNGMWYSA